MTYTGATKMDDDEPADGYSGCGVVTDEIPCHGAPPILNVRCDTHGPVTVQAERCEAVAERRCRMTDVASLQMERDRLRAELAEVRRLLLPHPDAKAGEDAGCACDLHSAVTAAAWAAAELKRLQAELTALRAGGDRVQHTGGE